jgi:hypothetical protein
MRWIADDKNGRILPGRRLVEMNYWVYENWTAEHKAVIHRSDCGNCNDGHGCHPNPLGNRNGKWRGPFVTLALAQAAAASTKRRVRQHSCV